MNKEDMTKSFIELGCNNKYAETLAELAINFKPSIDKAIFNDEEIEYLNQAYKNMK